MIAAVTEHLVVGAGLTGISCLRYLQKEGAKTRLYNDMFDDAALEKIKVDFPLVKVFSRNENISEVLANVKTLVLSPGVPLTHPLVMQAREQNVEIIGDVEIFARVNTKPVVAVTGSNGKSTVVNLVYLMAIADGRLACLAGNIGQPVLDGLTLDDVELYVLELSSFQLDTTESLDTQVSCILNLSPDHLDRYESYDSYINSKKKIYRHAGTVIYNRNDLNTYPDKVYAETLSSFGHDQPEDNQYGLLEQNGESWLAKGKNALIPVSGLLLKRSVDIDNALSALAIADNIDISIDAISEVLASFSGLPHRCEFVKSAAGVSWYNDSKATNVGACMAALKSFDNENIILIAGGDAKGADISILSSCLENKVKCLLLIGKDAELFVACFSRDFPCEVFDDFSVLMQRAKEIALPGDIVLLSPACSSLDMFDSYEHRGNTFKALLGVNHASQ